MFVRSAFDKRVRRKVRKSSILRLVPVRDSLLHGADLAEERAGRLLVRVLKTFLVRKGEGGKQAFCRNESGLAQVALATYRSRCCEFMCV